jgi:hypothetical protein
MITGLKRRHAAALMGIGLLMSGCAASYNEIERAVITSASSPQSHADAKAKVTELLVPYMEKQRATSPRSLRLYSELPVFCGYEGSLERCNYFVTSRRGIGWDVSVPMAFMVRIYFEPATTTTNARLNRVEIDLVGLARN